MPLPDTTRDTITALVADAARLLPPQGPIDAFVALNTLQGFEDTPFEEAVVRAARLYAAQPFLPESRYREELGCGRIRIADIDATLAADLGAESRRPLAGGRTTLGQLQRVLLLHPLRHEGDAAVRWTLTESDALERLRDDIDPAARQRVLASARASAPATTDERSLERAAAGDLWHACVEAVSMARPSIVHLPPPVRMRDLILAADPRLDTDALVHPLLIRLTAAFLDQGVASWGMPDREAGLLAAVAGTYGGGLGPVEPWSRDLPRRLASLVPRLADDHLATDVIAEELRHLGAPEEQWPGLITASLLALRGWAGMIHQLERRPDRAPVRQLPCRLTEFLALRLLCDRAAAEWALGRLAVAHDGTGLAAAWVELRDRHPPRRGPGGLARAFLLHQVAQLLGLAGSDVLSLRDNELVELEQAIAAFDSIARRRIFHLAYERRHRTEVLDALADVPPPAPSRERPDVQAIFCIDDRCESFRRHLEECCPDVTTFGTAGFFAVPMYYRGLDDWHAIPLCPIVMRPAHTVTEEPADESRFVHGLRRSLRRSLGRLREGVSSGSHTLIRGGLVTSIGGALAAVPLVARVAFPRLTALVARGADGIARRGLKTRLTLDRLDQPPLADGTLPGFTPAEQAAIVRRVLEDTGLTTGFARLVVVLGHGSTSLNNPHESAYDCGACGGGRGGPNARAFALMANTAEVRDRLAAEGLPIPADTVFVGGLQDTCTSLVHFFDIDRIPASHLDAFRSFARTCRDVGRRDAMERCRRFDAVPLDVGPDEAFRRVAARAADLAQVRPEYGHASNAVCIVGRRDRTRGLFLDRRAFLVSYDPTQDADGRILERTLAAVGPVASGINLAYLFSRVDPIGYGAGTKLPHNITGLIGVMDGHASDLRTGLPVQGVEIHEPVRLLMVIDAEPERIRQVLDRLPPVRALVENRWIQLASWHPTTGHVEVHAPVGRDSGFVPYVAESRAVPIIADSNAYYRGHREHLPPARLLAGRLPGGVA